MSHQIPDTLMWRGEKWSFIGANRLQELFSPEKYGLSPGWTTYFHTVCYKAFVLQFSMIDEVLHLEKVMVHCEDEHYPPIHGVKAQPGPINLRVYDNLGIRLHYTGSFFIGRSLKFEYCCRVSLKPRSYEEAWELIFDDGVIRDIRCPSRFANDYYWPPYNC